jgi:hypothetical protein
VEELERQLAASEARVKELEGELQVNDDVSEAVGAEGPSLGLEARLRRLARLQDNARAALQDQSPLEDIVLQLCTEGQHLADEAAAEKDDLLQQVGS